MNFHVGRGRDGGGMTARQEVFMRWPTQPPEQINKFMCL